MNLLNNIKNEVEYIDNIAYLDIEGYLFFYYVLNDKEVFAISLNKPLISKEDLKLFNIKLNKKAVCTVDNIAYKLSMGIACKRVTHNIIANQIVRLDIRIDQQRTAFIHFQNRNFVLGFT